MSDNPDTQERMTENTAPRGTVARIGHPANDRMIIRGADCWREVDTGREVDIEDFRAGWHLA